uniref:Uncharacterized protein n=1 Tax=Rhizophora mucronata TaxID=61149 RepID=A0A2P2NFL7_RHIMU
MQIWTRNAHFFSLFMQFPFSKPFELLIQNQLLDEINVNPLPY